MTRAKRSSYHIALYTDDPLKGEPAEHPTSDGYARIAIPGVQKWPTIKMRYAVGAIDGVEHHMPECKTIPGLGAHAHHPYDHDVVFRFAEEAS